MTEAPSITVVVPCHDEEGNIELLVERLKASVEPVDAHFEVILVDDGSNDGTLDAMKAEHLRDPRIKFVALSRNFGHEAASTAGLSHARGEAIVLIDADLQDPPEVIPELVDKWREGYDLVFAKRGTRAGESGFKRLGSAVFYRLMRWLVQFDFPTDTGDFRLMSRSVTDAFLQMPERNRFVRGMVAWTGFRSTAVEYSRGARYAGETKYPLGKLILLTLDAITGFSTFPLRLVSMMGYVVTLFSAVATIWVAYQRLFLGLAIPGYALLVTGMFFLGGVQILMLGTIGEYVGRIYSETQRRPLFLVRELGGLDPSDKHPD